MKKVITLLVALMLLTSVAFAFPTVQTETVQIILDGGELQIYSTAANAYAFANVTLTGDTQSVQPTAIPDFQMIDATGDDAGWFVTFSLPTLQKNAGAADTLEMEYVNAATYVLDFNTGQAVDANGGPMASVLAWGDFNPLQTVVETAAGYGKGDYEWSVATAGLDLADYRIIINGDKLAGTYTGTLTATIQQNP